MLVDRHIVATASPCMQKRPTFGVVFGECWPFWCLHGALTPSALTSTCINCAVACRLRQKRPATASGVGRTATDSRLRFRGHLIVSMPGARSHNISVSLTGQILSGPIPSHRPIPSSPMLHAGARSNTSHVLHQTRQAADRSQHPLGTQRGARG